MSVVFEPLSAEFTRDPYAVYARLRASAAPSFDEATNTWLLSRFEHVESAARDPRLVRSLATFLDPQTVRQRQRAANLHDMPNHARFVQFSLLDSDGAVHERLRRLVLGAFSRSVVETYHHRIEQFVVPLVDTLLERGQVDFVADLASQVPGHIIGNLLGVPDEHCAQLRLWSENIVQFFDVERTPAHKRLAERATTEFCAYLRDLIRDKTHHPGDDLVSSLVAAKQRGLLDDTELISTCMLILMAGHGSTIDVLGTGMAALLQHPTQLAMLRTQPELLPLAVQEMFRFETPLPFFHRYASQDIELFGAKYPQGTRFGLLYGSANRDERVFADAARFQCNRQPNRHIAFGRGAHLCLGNQLSRVVMQVVFATLLPRVATFTLLQPEPIYRAGLTSRGLQSLKLTLVPA